MAEWLHTLAAAVEERKKGKEKENELERENCAPRRIAPIK